MRLYFSLYLPETENTRLISTVSISPFAVLAFIFISTLVSPLPPGAFCFVYSAYLQVTTLLCRVLADALTLFIHVRLDVRHNTNNTFSWFWMIHMLWPSIGAMRFEKKNCRKTSEYLARFEFLVIVFVVFQSIYFVSKENFVTKISWIKFQAISLQK